MKLFIQVRTTSIFGTGFIRQVSCYGGRLPSPLYLLYFANLKTKKGKASLRRAARPSVKEYFGANLTVVKLKIFGDQNTGGGPETMIFFINPFRGLNIKNTFFF